MIELSSVYKATKEKKMKKYFIIIVAILASCKKEETVVKEPVPFVSCTQPTLNISLCKKLIIGKWNWNYEKRYDRVTQSFIFKNPVSENYTRNIEFIDSSYALLYKNSSIERTVKYSVTTFGAVSGYLPDTTITALFLYTIDNNSIFDYAPLKICTDSLILNYSLYTDTRGIETWNRN